MDEFSDDGFDDLNDTVLQELENNALQATQAQKALSQAPPRVQQQAVNQNQNQNHNNSTFDYDFTFDDDDLDDTVVIDELAQPQQPRPAIQNIRPTQQPRVSANLNLADQQQWSAQAHHQPHVPLQQRPVYPTRPQYPTPTRPAPPPVPSQRYPPRPVPQARPPPPPSQFARPPPPPSQFVRPPVPISRPYPAQSTQTLHAANTGKQNEIIGALQARLAALETELTAAKGESAILRSKYDKTQATHDAEIARLRKQAAEQAAKHEQLVEEASKAERKAATELQFARQDLREELGRAKGKKKDGSTTPKKAKSWGIVDGFDGNEMIVSPTKGQAQKRKEPAPAVVPLAERTPTKGKRKRPAVDSPTFALETHSEDFGIVAGPSDTATAPAAVRPEPLSFDVS